MKLTQKDLSEKQTRNLESDQMVAVKPGDEQESTMAIAATATARPPKSPTLRQNNRKSQRGGSKTTGPTKPALSQ